MIRELAADELAWFMEQALMFAGHANPRGLARALQHRLKESARRSSSTYALFDSDRGVAGVTARLEAQGESAARLYLAPAWHAGEPSGLLELTQELLERYPHDVAILPLHLLNQRRCDELKELLAPLGFVREDQVKLRFELSEVPPLGVPLVLEAYRESEERLFRALHEEAEGRRASDALWAYLKRKGGPFRPDLWFLARETLDQEAVGYAFCGTPRRGIDAVFSLNGVGVLHKHRLDSEMLRRLVLTVLQELAGISPLGRLETELPITDPKLIEILGWVGFEEIERVPQLLKRPK